MLSHYAASKTILMNTVSESSFACVHMYIDNRPSKTLIVYQSTNSPNLSVSCMSSPVLRIHDKHMHATNAESTDKNVGKEKASQLLILCWCIYGMTKFVNIFNSSDVALFKASLK